MIKRFIGLWYVLAACVVWAGGFGSAWGMEDGMNTVHELVVRQKQELSRGCDEMNTSRTDLIDRISVLPIEVLNMLFNYLEPKDREALAYTSYIFLKSVGDFHTRLLYKTPGSKECFISNSIRFYETLEEEVIKKPGFLNQLIMKDGKLLSVSPIHVIAMSRRLEVLMKCVALGADLHLKDKKGRTPFHYIFIHSWFEYVYGRIQYELPSYTFCGIDRETKLCKCFKNLNTCVEFFIGLNPESAFLIDQDDEGDTPLHKAICLPKILATTASKSSRSLKEGLIKKLCSILPADQIDQKNKKGDSLLLSAVRGDMERYVPDRWHHHYQVWRQPKVYQPKAELDQSSKIWIRYLLQNGADPLVRNLDDQCALPVVLHHVGVKKFFDILPNFDMDKPSCDGHTPWCAMNTYFARVHNKDTVQKLFGRGIKPDVTCQKCQQSLEDIKALWNEWSQRKEALARIAARAKSFVAMAAAGTLAYGLCQRFAPSVLASSLSSCQSAFGFLYANLTSFMASRFSKK